MCSAACSPSHATQGSDARPAPVGAPDSTLQALACLADPLRLPPRCLHIGPQKHGIAGSAGMKRCRRRMRRRSCPPASPARSGAPCWSLRLQALPPTPARRAPAGLLLPQLHAGSYFEPRLRVRALVWLTPLLDVRHYALRISSAALYMACQRVCARRDGVGGLRSTCSGLWWSARRLS